jgi:hypothetical protein
MTRVGGFILSGQQLPPRQSLRTLRPALLAFVVAVKDISLTIDRDTCLENTFSVQGNEDAQLF